MRVLIVDDNPDRHKVFDEVYAGDEVVHTYGYYDTTDALNNGPKFDIIQLDHDLGDFRVPDHMVEMYGKYELNGYHIAVYFAMDLPYDKRPDRVIIHSVNPDGAQSIYLWLERHGFDVVKRPFIIQG